MYILLKIKLKPFYKNENNLKSVSLFQKEVHFPSVFYNFLIPATIVFFNVNKNYICMCETCLAYNDLCGGVRKCSFLNKIRIFQIIFEFFE